MDKKVKNKLILSSAILLVVIFTAGFIFSTWNENMLKSFGKKNFTVEKWHNANSQERAEMAYSFVTKYDVQSLTYDDIRKYLGEPTAYYNYDSNLAYRLAHNNKGYLIAFVIADNGKVKRYVVRSYQFVIKNTKPSADITD